MIKIFKPLKININQSEFGLNPYKKEQNTKLNKIQTIDKILKNKSSLVSASSLKFKLAKIELKNKLLLFLNKKTTNGGLVIGTQKQQSLTKKINNKMNNSLNQSIVYNFAKNNNKIMVFDKLLNNNNNNNNNNPILLTSSILKNISFLKNNKELIKKTIININQITALSKLINWTKNNGNNTTKNKNFNLNNKNQLGIVANINKILVYFFKSLSCLISKPQWIHKNNKLLIRIYYYQNQNPSILQQNNSLLNNLLDFKNKSNKKSYTFLKKNNKLITNEVDCSAIKKMNKSITKKLLNFSNNINEQTKITMSDKALKKIALNNFINIIKKTITGASIKNDLSWFFNFLYFNANLNKNNPNKNIILASAINNEKKINYGNNLNSPKKLNKHEGIIQKIILNSTNKTMLFPFSFPFPFVLKSILKNNKMNFNLKLIKLINKTIKLGSISKNNINLKNLNKIKIKQKIKNILLAYYNPLNSISYNNNLIKNNLNKFKKLGKLLSTILKKNIDLQLIKMPNIALEPRILAQVISKNSKFKKSQHIIKNLMKKIVIMQANLLSRAQENSILESNSKLYGSASVLTLNKNLNNLIEAKNKLTVGHINDFNKNINTHHTNPLTLAKTVGLQIKFAGRLLRDRMVPKKTVKVVSVGSLSRGAVGHLEKYCVTSKNKRGAFSITIKMAHSRTYSTLIEKNTTNSNLLIE